MSADVPEDLAAILACPEDHTNLLPVDDGLQCSQHHAYPIVDGVPVLLTDDLEPTLPDVFASTRSLLQTPDELAAGVGGARAFVQDWIIRTNGNLYRNVSLPLARYPIPALPVTPRADGDVFLDVGGNWGRWAIAAAHAGFKPVVIDPNLQAALVGRHIAGHMGVEVRYVVGDARALPIADRVAHVAFSYSVLQHFDKRVAVEALTEMSRVLMAGGRSLVQFPNAFGVRQATNLARQKLSRNTNPFRVRYWTPRGLVSVGEANVGPSSLAVDGFFSLDPRPEDRDLLPPWAARLVGTSDLLKRRSRSPGLRWLRTVADSLWLLSDRR